jgi:Ras-related protein Rab-18
MSGDLIHSIVYTIFDDAIGPNPIYFLPSDLPENIRMLVGIKTITILSGDQGFIPESLVIIPFSSIKLKGIIKYIERDDKERRGKVAQSAITFLFKESDDAIFMQYMNYLEGPFNEIARKIGELEESKASRDAILTEIKNLQDSIRSILNELRVKETTHTSNIPFPEKLSKLEKSVNYKFKITICGDPGVGKTSTILRFTDNAFSRRYIPTMGVNISDKVFQIQDKFTELIIWDIAGQSKFETMRQHFYQGSDAVMLIFDIANRKSFLSIRDWYHDIKKYLSDSNKLTGFIIGNKSDISHERKVSKQEAQKLATELDLNYSEISALTGKNVEFSFYQITEKLLESKKARMDN